jgi:phosphatidylglycerophosphate synthase
LSISFQERLRKFEPPFVLPITPRDQGILERRLFDWSYKGVTDLVTKWAWPHPARWVVGWCVRFGLRPNHVTVVGLILVFLASILFAYGRYGWGLLAGWLMTFLDTVDGKLARVTVTSSRFGHYFDHIIDIVHPPIWYICWGLGLEAYDPGVLGLSLGALFWLIMAGYVAGRLVEATFTAGLGRFGIFCWRPVDSYFRLITARRNPCMILLTGCTLFGRPDLGLMAVASWTVLTSIFLLIRLTMAFLARIRQGALRSWLKDADQQFYNGSLALRLFTRRIAG